MANSGSETTDNRTAAQILSDRANAELITKFYEAFALRDAETMVSCYHPDVVFRDPAFGVLRGEQAADMWRMLCKIGKDLKVRFNNVEVHGGRGQAHWEADYTFFTKLKVHNVVDAEFDFADGLIIRHTDSFDFSRWAAQAFGPPGFVIGKVPVVPRLIMQTMGRSQLARFSAARAQSATRAESTRSDS